MCLLPEAGIECWEAKENTHSDNLEGTPRLAASLDQAMSARWRTSTQSHIYIHHGEESGFTAGKE